MKKLFWILLVIVIGVFILLAYNHMQSRKPVLVQKPEEQEIVKQVPVTKETQPVHKPMMAIVIDDIGYDNKVFRKFADLGIPLTFSILPGQRYSVNIAKNAKLLNYEVMLHLPMEPRSAMRNPGNGVILHNMSRGDMLLQLSKDIKSVPNIVGVNNHMGSLLTEDSNAMNILLEEIRNQGLYFLDSKTTPNSKAYEIAKRIGIKSGRRDIFLDNNADVEYIKRQIDTAISAARHKGEAIAIGHPRAETVAALRAKLHDFKNEGIELVPLSRVLN